MPVAGEPVADASFSVGEGEGEDASVFELELAGDGEGEDVSSVGEVSGILCSLSVGVGDA